MLIDSSKPETDFIPIKNDNGGQRFHTEFGHVVHFATRVQNTTINPKYKAKCGKIMKTALFKFANPVCKKCFDVK